MNFKTSAASPAAALAAAALAAVPTLGHAHHGGFDAAASFGSLEGAGVLVIALAVPALLIAGVRALRARVAAKADALEARAHCDGPCGIYDPASARIAAESVMSMTKKMLALELPAASDASAMRSYLNTYSRFSAIKEEQAQAAKDELLILWTDYFKPPHLEQFPELHDTFWQAAKCCSACKVELSETHAAELMQHVEKIHDMFWKSKSRDVAYYTAA